MINYLLRTFTVNLLAIYIYDLHIFHSIFSNLFTENLHTLHDILTENSNFPRKEKGKLDRKSRIIERFFLPKIEQIPDIKIKCQMRSK